VSVICYSRLDGESGGSSNCGCDGHGEEYFWSSDLIEKWAQTGGGTAPE
jgi:hypothetical protein